MSDFGLAQWPYFGGPRPECRECSYCVVESDTDSLGASHMVFSYCSFDHGECPHAGRKPETVAHAVRDMSSVCEGFEVTE